MTDQPTDPLQVLTELYEASTQMMTAIEKSAAHETFLAVFPALKEQIKRLQAELEECQQR